MIMNDKYIQIVNFIREIYKSEQPIQLHEPKFTGNEIKYLTNCIKSTFVSTVGNYVEQFESMVADFTGAKYAVATVNGTSALHMSLIVSGVKYGDEVITQALSFVAASNAISYCGAKPIFIDVDLETLGMCPQSLLKFLKKNTKKTKFGLINIGSGKKISAVIPMHTFGHPCKIKEISDICDEFGLTLIEDAAESLGSYYKSIHTGLFGSLGVLSFNGNKIITTGGGGMILTNNKELAMRAKHLTTTAKKNHPFEFSHDNIGYNYRLPNINAAIGCGQMEMLENFLESKRVLAEKYFNFLNDIDFHFFKEPTNCSSNYWLNILLAKNLKERNSLLKFMNDKGIKIRPAWKLINELDMYKHCETSTLQNSKWLENRIINLPSSVIL